MNSGTTGGSTGRERTATWTLPATGGHRGRRRRSWPSPSPPGSSCLARQPWRRLTASALKSCGHRRTRTCYPCSWARRTALRSGTCRTSGSSARARAAEWIRVPPNVIKDRLDQANDTPASRKPDVWVLGPRFDGAQLTVHPGDRIVITSANGTLPLGHLPWRADGRAGRGPQATQPRSRPEKTRATGAASRSPTSPGTGNSPYEWRDSAVASTRAGWTDIPACRHGQAIRPDQGSDQVTLAQDQVHGDTVSEAWLNAVQVVDASSGAPPLPPGNPHQRPSD